MIRNQQKMKVDKWYNKTNKRKVFNYSELKRKQFYALMIALLCSINTYLMCFSLSL